MLLRENQLLLLTLGTLGFSDISTRKQHGNLLPSFTQLATMKHNLLTISHPDADLKDELFQIKEKYGISTSRFVYEATKKEIKRINRKAPLI